MNVCERHCDHCYPDALHRCALPEGHGGYCSCQPTGAES